MGQDDILLYFSEGPVSYISTLAICLFRRNDRILVFEGHHTIKRETFYRPAGGSKDILYPNGLLEMLR